jgi:hypothetical protein
MILRLVVLVCCYLLLCILGGFAAQLERIDEMERVAVHIEPNVDANELAAKHGYHNLGGVHGLDHHYVFQKLPADQHRADVDASKHIGEHEHVKWWEPQNQRRLKRPLPHWNGEDERINNRNRQ